MRLTVMTVGTPLMMKVMTVSLIPGPSPALGRREIRESLTRLSHQRADRLTAGASPPTCRRLADRPRGRSLPAATRRCRLYQRLLFEHILRGLRSRQTEHGRRSAYRSCPWQGDRCRLGDARGVVGKGGRQWLAGARITDRRR
ncbi:MAG: hypothetical protein AW07_02059 [Candidatus Accumulibacter sp. SK-11]|nr:MAG: hypothetical protein AW07_02059 [Candidatus Accumulibacter sp. SK-11]